MTRTANNRQAAIQGLRMVLGVAFLTIGLIKLNGALGSAPMFEHLGWAPWLRYVSGALDAGGALLVLTRRWTFHGALLLTCMVGITTELTLLGRLQGSPVTPIVLTLLAAALTGLTSPGGQALSRDRDRDAMFVGRPKPVLQ